MERNDQSTAELFCTFYVGELFFGVEVFKVQEVIRQQRMTGVPLASKEIKGLMNLRGQIVTAIDLCERLGLDRPDGQDSTMNVVIRHSDSAVSLLVDEIGDVIQVPQEHFEAPPETLQGVPRTLIRGAYKLDGKLMLVLETDKVLDLAA